MASSPAKAGDPVITALPVDTGCPASAGHDGCALPPPRESSFTRFMPYRRTENVVRRLAAREKAILAAARTIAAEDGMGAVQVAGVAARAGIAAGTVYRYFPSKN